MILDSFSDFGTQKAPFSIGFIRYFDLAECYILYSEKRNAFLLFFGSSWPPPSSAVGLSSAPARRLARGGVC